MAGSFIPYITQAGDRWDLLAWRFYGNAMLFGPIVQTNRAIPIEAVFEAGLSIGIPILQVNQSVAANQDVAPWKKNS